MQKTVCESVKGEYLKNQLKTYRLKKRPQDLDKMQGLLSMKLSKALYKVILDFPTNPEKSSI